MTLQEVLKSRKPFRRKEWGKFATELSHEWRPLFKGETVYDYVALTMKDLLAEDWESEEELKSFNRTQMAEALQRAIKNWNDQSESELDFLILKELGFE